MSKGIVSSRVSEGAVRRIYPGKPLYTYADASLGVLSKRSLHISTFNITPVSVKLPAVLKFIWAQTYDYIEN